MKNLALALVGAALCVSSAFAGDIAPEKIIGAAIGDWNRDGNADLALLIAPEDDGDDIGIYIYVRDREHLLLHLAAAAPNKVSGNTSLDGMFGRDAGISTLPNGSISVHSENSGGGRDRWEQTLTIAYRNATFVVAGFTYTHHDTLDPDNSGTCDYNVLSGKVSSGGKERKVDARTVAVADWADQTAMDACGIRDE
ncbi:MULTISPECIES: hypothetical protein [Rhizobium]|uniref:VCBS repeat-containing protein n=1 Tax=Rhizobium rhododendri TaxID=2506430 RepID=A0ABY8IKP4_9HYPH|nr:MULTISPECIES: hypothetical protein [Rhizobium]WFS23846.1 hypothetical protein PR018_04885 [Rhizobium rhododendri]